MNACVVCSTEQKPKQADGDTLACFGCSNRILRYLRELELYLPTLSLQKTISGGERRAPGFGSRSPANDTTIHHTDWRTGWDALDGLGAMATIHSWASAVREDRDLTPPEHTTMLGEVNALRSNHSWIVCQPFVDEYARELREIHGAVRAAASDPVPRSVGHCLAVTDHGDCNGNVYELDDASGVRCSECRRVYSGPDLARFRIAQEAR